LLVPRLPWERHPRRSLSVVARVWGSHAGAWEPSIIRTVPIVPMLPRGNVARVAPCRWLRSAWGSHAGAWEPSNIRTMPIIPILPRGNVARVAPCRWLRSAWGSHAGAWEPSSRVVSRASCSWSGDIARSQAPVGTPPASFLVGGCACLGLPRRSVGAIKHQSSLPCRSFPCSCVGTPLACSLPLVTQCLGLPCHRQKCS